MRQISTLEPTRYEITARHADGREFLICYAAGSVSGRRLRQIISERGQTIVDALKISPECRFATVNKPRPHAYLEDWKVGFTGRTQREVRMTGEHQSLRTVLAFEGTELSLTP